MPVNLTEPPVASATPARSPSLALSAWAITAAFGTYFCMYAFRKPFTAATYSDTALAGVGYKTVLVTAQVLGYTLSKFVAIKVIAEMRPQRRADAILRLIGMAQAALLLFALVPPPWNFICLFLNGLPLGMVFGLVLGFLEGRQVTEALTAGLCASFIVASGVVKTAGATFLQWGVSEYWMPFATGLVFLAPLLVFVAMLRRIPPPSPEDLLLRQARPPMLRSDRRRFYSGQAWGLTCLIGMFVVVTVLRSIRDDFAAEIWNALGHAGEPAIFTYSEMLVMFGVVAVNGAAILLRDNRAAFFTALATALGGLLLMVLALGGLAGGHLSGFAFMVLVGLGLYIPYVAVHTTIFERLIALVRDPANLGFLMCLADAFGYLGYVVLILCRPLLPGREHFLDFFTAAAWVGAAVSMGFTVLAWIHFARRTAFHR